MPVLSVPGTKSRSLGPKGFATNADEAYFWSGIGVEEVAGRIAARGGGTTLEQLMAARGIKLPTWDANNPAVVAAWVAASRTFARQASGTVRAVIGSKLKPGSVWETTELPTLMNNPNVKQIIRIDPATGAETVIFKR